jgi:hypothetical protein
LTIVNRRFAGVLSCGNAGTASANAQTAQAEDCLKVVELGFTSALQPYAKVKKPGASVRDIRQGEDLLRPRRS